MGYFKRARTLPWALTDSSLRILDHELIEPTNHQRILSYVNDKFTCTRSLPGFSPVNDLFRKIFSRSTSTTPNPAPARSSRTAAYDGLRGLACLLVFNFHFLYPYTKSIINGYGAKLDDNHDWQYPHQLPILCLLVRGRAMVTLFFAISGYVLSYGFLASTRNNPQSLDHYSRMSSLAFRRWVRLYVPASISMFLVNIAAYMGAYEQGRKLKTSEWMQGVWEQHPPQLKSLRAYLKNYCRMWVRWQKPFVWWSYYSDYDPHTWTIPTEFRDSMVLFLVLIASAGLKPRWRFGLLVLTTAFCFANHRWDVATFIGGAVVADIHIWQKVSPAILDEKQHALPTDSSSEAGSPSQADGSPSASSEAVEIATSVSKWILLLTSLWVLSFPDAKGPSTPGFIWLHKLTPPGYEPLYDDPHAFWHALAAVPILWSITNIPSINNFLSSSIPQYLGKISYGLYLVHGPLLHSIGFALQPKIWEYVGGGDSDVRYCFGLLLGWMTMLCMSIFGAHLFWRFVDMPLVKAARWLEKRASREKTES